MSDPPLTLRDLAIKLVTNDHDAALSDVPSKDVRRTLINLHHFHLPKLADAGVIEYNADLKLISFTSLEGWDTLLTMFNEERE